MLRKKQNPKETNNRTTDQQVVSQSRSYVYCYKSNSLFWTLAKLRHLSPRGPSCMYVLLTVLTLTLTLAIGQIKIDEISRQLPLDDVPSQPQERVSYLPNQPVEQPNITDSKLLINQKTSKYIINNSNVFLISCIIS